MEKPGEKERERKENKKKRQESKFKCEDPKDGELYLERIKSGETLMEVRSDANVQIARQI